MARLKKTDYMVVRDWWRCSEECISENGFTLDLEYRRSASTCCEDCKLEENSKSFSSIVERVGVGNALASAISNKDISNQDGSPALVRGSRVVLSVWTEPPEEIAIASFDVFHHGCYTVVATLAVPPGPGPPQRGGLSQRLLQWFR